MNWKKIGWIAVAIFAVYYVFTNGAQAGHLVKHSVEWITGVALPGLANFVNNL